MTCEKCKSKRATVFFTESDRTRHSMCAGCAQQYKNQDIEVGEKDIFEEIYTPLLNLFELDAGDQGFFLDFDNGTQSKKKCAVCGIDENTLIARGEMGCPSCYEFFDHCLSSADGANKFRMPNAQRKRAERIKMAQELKVKLKEAISGEDFESAAKLRDKIKELEKEA